MRVSAQRQEDDRSTSSGTGGGAAPEERAPARKPACEVTRPPAGLGCAEGKDPSGVGTNIKFGKDSAEIADSDRQTLSEIAAGWHRTGERTTLNVDGFASCDGAAANNWRLSCKRAQAVATELKAPTDGSAGVPATNLRVAANGETELFGSLLTALNRCVVVSSAGAPPPGPACGLTITGPATVDHFCGRDAQSCGVFPAPNITLTGGGASAGSTLTWSIAAGSSRASIVGPNTGTSVQIRGDAASGATDDVLVQVTDGNCTSTHTLTVRQPTDMTSTQQSSKPPGRVRARFLYTVRDQFGAAMGAGICVHEAVTVCADNHPELGPPGFGDAPTNANGQVADTVDSPLPSTPPPLCTKVDQVVTAAGCPVMHNTITVEQSGVTLTRNSSCTAGGSCP